MAPPNLEPHFEVGGSPPPKLEPHYEVGGTRHRCWNPTTKSVEPA